MPAPTPSHPSVVRPPPMDTAAGGSTPRRRATTMQHVQNSVTGGNRPHVGNHWPVANLASALAARAGVGRRGAPHRTAGRASALLTWPAAIQRGRVPRGSRASRVQYPQPASGARGGLSDWFWEKAAASAPSIASPPTPQLPTRAWADNHSASQPRPRRQSSHGSFAGGWSRLARASFTYSHW